jgi:hypothetical protein
MACSGTLFFVALQYFSIIHFSQMVVQIPCDVQRLIHISDGHYNLSDSSEITDWALLASPDSIYMLK